MEQKKEGKGKERRREQREIPPRGEKRMKSLGFSNFSSCAKMRPERRGKGWGENM